jgi:hypothetical protein
MGKRSRRSFDRFFILMVMISVGGWLIWEYVIPSIRGSSKSTTSQPQIVNPVVPAIDTQAIVHTIVTFLLWALFALVIFGLIWALWKYRGKLFPPPSPYGPVATSTNPPIDGEILRVNPKWTWNPKIMDDSASKLWKSMWDFITEKGGVERYHHDKLYNWLKNNFPQAEYEKTKGGIRVDIAIGDIAIEVKGPTRNKDLESISKQALTRLNYYKNVIFVLCEPEFKAKQFDEIEKAIKQKLPEVGVITFG